MRSATWRTYTITWAKLDSTRCHTAQFWKPPMGISMVLPTMGGANSLGTTTGIGTIYRVATALPPVITLTSSAGSVDAGKPVTLTWAANNVYSKNDQICVAYSSDGTWSGIVSTSGTITVTPVGPNTVNYAVTCAGVETAMTSLIVGSSVPLSVTHPRVLAMA